MNAPDVLNRIAEHRRRQVDVVKYLKSKDTDLGDLVGGCGSWLHLREWLETGESRLRNANFCQKYLLCRCCAARRASKLVAKYAEKVETVMNHHSEASAGVLSYIPAMVTLTVKNGHDLQERLKHLKKAYSKMLEARRKGASASGRHSAVEWNCVVGAVRSIEITRSEESGWHPHAHVFVLLHSYIDHATLAAEWERFTGDSFVVGITKCKGLSLIHI